jgi:hypothetical protein
VNGAKAGECDRIAGCERCDEANWRADEQHTLAHVALMTYADMA